MAGESLGAGAFQPPPADAQGKEHRAAADLTAAIEVQHVQIAR